MNGFPSAVTCDRRLASFFTRRNGVGECRFTPREALISSGFERARLQPCRKHCKIDGGFSPAARYLELAWWLEDQVFAAAALQPRNLTVSSWLLSWRQPFSPEKPSSPEPSWPELFSLRSSWLEASSRRPFWPAASPLGLAGATFFAAAFAGTATVFAGGAGATAFFAGAAGLAASATGCAGASGAAARRSSNSFGLASTLSRSRCSLGTCRSGGSFPSSSLRRGRRRRRRRLVRLQEIHDLLMRTQLAVHQQQERLVQNLLIFRELGCNTKLGHLGKWQFLFDLPPLAEEVLQLLIDCLLLGGQAQEQNVFRRGLRQKLPGSRRHARLLCWSAFWPDRGRRFPDASTYPRNRGAESSAEFRRCPCRPCGE